MVAINDNGHSQTPAKGPPQTHYQPPFGDRPHTIVSASLFSLSISALLVLLLFDSGMTVLVALCLMVVIFLGGAAFAFITSPSVGLPRRQRFNQKDVYSIRPFFARRCCEETGGKHFSDTVSCLVDYDAPYVEYSFYRIEWRVKWEPALFVAEW